MARTKFAQLSRVRRRRVHVSAYLSACRLVFLGFRFPPSNISLRGAAAARALLSRTRVSRESATTKSAHLDDDKLAPACLPAWRKFFANPPRAAPQTIMISRASSSEAWSWWRYSGFVVWMGVRTIWHVMKSRSCFSAIAILDWRIFFFLWSDKIFLRI